MLVFDYNSALNKLNVNKPEMNKFKLILNSVIKTVLLLAVYFVTSLAQAAGTKVTFLNDWKWEGPAAAFLMAWDEGYYSERGLDVSMDPGKGSVDGLAKVASGEYQFGSVDINTLIRYKDKNPDSQIKAVFVIYNSPPFAIIGRRSLGVIGPRDLEGHKLGAPAADGAYAQWPAFVHSNQIDEAMVTIEDVSFAEREAKLASGDVDAIAGFSFSSMLNLTSKGVAVNDISLMLMSDFGLDLYGNVIIVNPEFAENNPNDVTAFVRASTQGYIDTVANPAKALKHVLARNESAVESTELSRLIMAIGHHIVTDEVREHGVGALQLARLEKSIEQISKSYTFSNRPSAADIFDDSYLPPLAARKLIEQAPPEEVEEGVAIGDQVN